MRVKTYPYAEKSSCVEQEADSLLSVTKNEKN